MASRKGVIIGITDEERISQVEEKLAHQKILASNDKAKNSITKQVNGTGFFSQPNVKQYQGELVAHTFGKDKPKKTGRGTFFDSVEELNEWMSGYFDLVARTEVTPTISALCVWLQCDRQTLFNHARNPNSPFFESSKFAIDICHSALELGASESKLNSVAYIFQAKNYFGMKDTQDVQVSAKQVDSNDPETVNALKEQIEKERLSITDYKTVS